MHSSNLYVIIVRQKRVDHIEIKELLMTNRLNQFGIEHWIALLLVGMLFILLLLTLVGLVASYLISDPHSLQPHLYAVSLALLGAFIFSLYVLKHAWSEIRSLLPIAGIAGLVVGIFLGSIFNLPYYLGLLLYFGVFGPFMALTSTGPTDVASAYRLLDIALSTLAVLLSFSLYTLVAFFITRRTGNATQGLWGAFLAAFVAVLVATFTFVTLAVISSFSTFFSQWMLSNLASYQFLPLQTMPLSFAQAVHAAVGGLLGTAIARRYLRRGRVSESK